jgi:hypothetical protein
MLAKVKERTLAALRVQEVEDVLGELAFRTAGSARSSVRPWGSPGVPLGTFRDCVGHWRRCCVKSALLLAALEWRCESCSSRALWTMDLAILTDKELLAKCAHLGADSSWSRVSACRDGSRREGSS